MKVSKVGKISKIYKAKSLKSLMLVSTFAIVASESVLASNERERE